MDTAFVLVTCDLGSEKSVIDELKDVKSINEVHGTFGIYDIVAKVENFDVQKILDSTIAQIRKIPHVRSTLTLVGIPEQS